MRVCCIFSKVKENILELWCKTKSSMQQILIKTLLIKLNFTCYETYSRDFKNVNATASDPKILIIDFCLVQLNLQKRHLVNVCPFLVCLSLSCCPPSVLACGGRGQANIHVMGWHSGGRPLNCPQHETQNRGVPYTTQ